MIISLYLYVLSHRQLYVVFPAGLKVGLMIKKFGSVGSLDGSSGSYLQTKLFGCDTDSLYVDHMFFRI